MKTRSPKRSFGVLLSRQQTICIIRSQTNYKQTNDYIEWSEPNVVSLFLWTQRIHQSIVLWLVRGSSQECGISLSGTVLPAGTTLISPSTSRTASHHVTFLLSLVAGVIFFTSWGSKNLNYYRKQCLGQIWRKPVNNCDVFRTEIIQNNMRILINHRPLGWYCYL